MRHLAHANLSAWLTGHMLYVALGVLAIACMKRAVTKGPGRKGTPNERNLAERTRKMLGYDKDADLFVKWARRDAVPGAVVEVRTPQTYAPKPADLTVVADLIHNLAGGVWTPARRDASHLLTFTRQPPPRELPDLYRYDPGAYPLHRVPAAVNTPGKVRVAALDAEAPHVLIAGPTGTGKTNVINTFVAHVAGKGALVDIIDPKRAGYVDSFIGLGNVRVTTRTPEMIPRVSEVHADMVERYTRLESRQSIAHLPPRFLIIDEMGSFTQQVKVEWRNTRDPKVDPATPPTMDEILRILWQGRAADVHVIIAAQQANASVLGGTDSREQFGMRIGCGAPGENGGAFLFGDQNLPAVDPEVRGRGLISLNGGKAEAVQLAHLTAAEARAYASRGGVTFDTYYGAAPDALPLVPDDAPTVELPRPKAQRTPVPLDCRHCGHTWTSRAEVETSVACPGCGKSRRIPKGARDTVAS